MHWGVFRALEDINSALGDVSIAMEHPECTDNILHTNHDTPNSLMISSNAMSTSMHRIHIIQGENSFF